MAAVVPRNVDLAEIAEHAAATLLNWLHVKVHDVLNEVSARRNKYEDWEEWEDAKEESYGEDDYGDHHC